MKQAKQQFDDLVARLKSGDDISFGQMERVYAEAFLQSFLERTEKQKKRALSSLRRQQREFNDDYGDDESEDSFSTEAIDRQELDYVRTIVETLGVKPTVDQLSRYTTRAIRRNYGYEEKWRFILPTFFRGTMVFHSRSGVGWFKNNL